MRIYDVNLRLREHDGNHCLRTVVKNPLEARRKAIHVMQASGFTVTVIDSVVWREDLQYLADKWGEEK